MKADLRGYSGSPVKRETAVLTLTTAELTPLKENIAMASAY
jgi:hypothetical protein